jgi:sugar/nucleoside kinase (ribokinase family)
MQEFDFISIGYVATDNFIELLDAEVHCDKDGENCKISIPFGEKVPFKGSTIVPAVGNAANAAMSANRLGLRTAFVSNIGDDSSGKEDLAAFTNEGVDTRFITVHKDKKTNYHYVILYKSERTILINHEQFPFTFPDIGKPKWLYLSSFSNESPEFYSEIIKYLTENPEVHVAFQPGTFEINMGYEKMSELYKLSKIFFCNVEEAQKISGINPENMSRRDEVKILLSEMRKLGPQTVVITDGVAGAYAYDGTEFLFMPPYPDIAPPVDRTGAGDSFASTVVSAVALDLPLATALEWGPVNSMSVVQYIGAREGLLTREKIQEYLAKRPTNYKIERI